MSHNVMLGLHVLVAKASKTLHALINVRDI